MLDRTHKNSLELLTTHVYLSREKGKAIAPPPTSDTKYSYTKKHTYLVENRGKPNRSGTMQPVTVTGSLVLGIAPQAKFSRICAV